MDTALTLPLVSGANCLHCGQKVTQSPFCCAGCKTVYTLLHSRGLEKFYDLKPKRILPLLNYFSRQEDLSWVPRLQGFEQGLVRLRLEGIQCAACVWAIIESARRLGSAQVTVDVAVGRMEIRFDPKAFELQKYLSFLQELGYRTAPVTETGDKGNTDLLLRLGVCAAIAMNTMFLAISSYLGLNATDGLLFDLFLKLDFYLSFISVAVGGSCFIRRAVTSLKQGLLHFDLPIALGLLAAFTGSAIAFVKNQHQSTYFDTVNIFIALMLAGRYAQERFLQKNRQALLDEPGLGHLETTRIDQGFNAIRFDAVKKGDRLLIQPGSIIPVEATLLSPEAELSLAWISGEAMPVTFKQNTPLPAGAHLVGTVAVEVEALTDFEKSSLTLLTPLAQAEAPLPFVWEWVTRRYVILVLSASLGGLAFWLWANPSKALSVFVSILVVTCPCSLGIAIPLARSLANKALLTRGLFARDGALLDKCAAVKNIFLDKTGTLTLAHLKVINPETFQALSSLELNILFNAVARSRHPASQALYCELKGPDRPVLSLFTTEIAGRGLEIIHEGEKYFLGRRPTAEGPQTADYEVDFFQREALLARFFLRESLVEDAAETLQKLAPHFEIHLLSGDKPARVSAMAKRLGLDEKKAHAALSPFQKAAFLEKAGEKSLMLGDGLNDSPAFGRALISGAPVWERSILAGQSSFFYIAGSLSWLADLFALSRRFLSTVRMNIRFSLIYNLGVIAICLMGLMQPLWAAILMPSGSIAIVALTVARMKKGAA